jgi:hypothetical protein
MRLRSSALIIAIVVGLLGSPAFAQGVLITSTIPLSTKVQYDVENATQRAAIPILFVDERPFEALSYVCTDVFPGSCVAVPEPAMIEAVNALPLPHTVDVALRNENGTSFRASHIRLAPPLPPAATACAWVSPSGVLSPKPIKPNPGYDDIRGWNEIPSMLDALGRRVPTAAGAAATYARELELRAWGLAYRVQATEVRNNKIWIYIYAPCLGPPQ